MSSIETRDEFFDEDLQSMGVKFTDETVPAQMPVMEPKPRPKVAERTRGAAKEECAPVPKHAPSIMDRLTSCATWACVCGGISMLLWWFWINDLMAQVAAYPCIVVCSGIGCAGVAWNAKGARG